MKIWERLRKHSTRNFIIISCLIALILSVFPWQTTYFFWLPDWIGMILLFWILNRPSSLQLGTVFLVGIIVDILCGSTLGFHALAYLCAAFFILQRRQQIIIYDFGMQAIMIGIALLISRVVMAISWALIMKQFIGWYFFIPPITTALLWPLLNKLMFKIFSKQI